MLKHLLLAVGCLIGALQISFAQVPDSCHPNTFLKHLGEQGVVENHSALCAAPDGNLYLAGLKGTRTAISKMTPEGTFLWTRSFLQPSHEPVFIAEIIVDSEGMIVGSGHRSRGVGARGFAFRYDPEANKMLWAYELVTPMPVVDGGILEKTPGGNFLLYQNVFVDAQSKRPEILELDRTTGQIVPGFTYRYSLANYDQAFTSLAIRDGALYASGYGVGLFDARRFLLIKIDATTGQVLRGEAGHHSWVKPSYFSGGDMILDDTSVVLLYHGSETTYDINDGSGNPVPLYLQKKALSGEALWAKKYMVNTLPKEVVAVPDGYVILGGDTDRYLLKTDKQGNLLTSKRLANPPFFKTDNGEQQNQMVLLGGHLFVADVAPTSASDQYTTLLKTDLNLDIEFECSRYQPWPLPDSVAMDLMTNYPMSASASTTTQQAIALSPTPDPVTVRETCPFCPETPDSCKPTTFLRIYGEEDKYEYMTALRAAPDGNLYLAGRKGTGMAIAKMAPDGTFLWVRNTTVPQEEIRIGEIIVDSEGMIVGSGHTDISSVVKGFAFRYDPATDQVIWAHKFDSNQATDGGILEKSPGGNFLLYQNPKIPGLGVRTGEVLELDRATGQIVPAFARRYALKSNQNFTSMVQHGGALYATGFTDTVQNFAASRRMVLTKLDAATGSVVWSRTGLTNFSQTSYFSAGDILVDDSSLIVLYHGIETSNTINGAGKVVPVYLQKTTLDGQVLWVKKFLFPAEYPVLPRDILAVPDGYIIWCGYTSRHLLKTDKDGNLLVSKILDSSNYFYPSGEDLQNNQIERIGSHLFFGLFTARYGQFGHYTTVLKTDLNLNMDFDCGLAPYPVEGSTVLNPVNFAAQQTVSASAATRQPVAMAFAPGSMTLLENCPFCANPVCTDKPDISFRIESVGCDSAAFVTWRLCNTGKQPYSGPLNVGVYDSNPLTSAATLLDLFSLQIDSLQPDSCQTGILNNLTYWGNYAKVYTLAGIESGQITPVDPAGFPYNGIAECDYANNLDSLDFQYPPAPNKPDLGPDRILCAGQTPTLDAGSGFVSYNWSNGQATQAVVVNVTGTYIVAATDACGQTLRDTVAVTVLPQPAPTTVTIQFYPGDTIIVAGTAYTQSETVVQTLLTADGCDSVVTTILQLVVTKVDLSCPGNLTVPAPPNQSSVNLTYPLPTATTDCPDPDIALTLLQGLPVGGAFPLGNTLVCYEAANHCGIRDTCCFTVTIQPAADEEACDVKIPPGSCIRFEVLNIQLDALGRPRYRMRLTNTCASPLKFVYFQLPNGMTAKAPLEGATYTAPGGNTYLVRNPNAAPFHSIRFKPLAGDLKNGESDIFEYTLPKQAQQAFILVSAKLADNTTFDAHLNTFSCPVLPYVAASSPAPLQGSGERISQLGASPRSFGEGPGVRLRPNPTSGLLFVDLLATPDQQVQVQVLNTQGQLVLEGRFAVENDGISLRLPEGLANGLYYLWVQPLGSGQRVATRFVLER